MAMGLKTDLISESYYSIEKVKAAMNGTWERSTK
jgi:hypothetical protein